MNEQNARRGFTQVNKHVVVCPPCGESQGQRPQSRKVGMRELGQEVVNEATLLDNPPSALCATSPTQGGKSTTRGFTLIELLVVVLIIGILAAVALPQYNKVIWKNRAAQIIPVVRALAEAEKRYWLENSTYATNFDELDLQFTQSKGYEEKKNYWTLHIHNIRSSQRVFAEINRFGNPWFYISYDLANNWLECMPEGDGGKDICKLFSKTEPYFCTGATYETYKCYRIQ